MVNLYHAEGGGGGNHNVSSQASSMNACLIIQASLQLVHGTLASLNSFTVHIWPLDQLQSDSLGQKGFLHVIWTGCVQPPTCVVKSLFA